MDWDIIKYPWCNGETNAEQRWCVSGVTNIMSDASSDEATQHIRPFLGSYKQNLVVGLEGTPLELNHLSQKQMTNFYIYALRVEGSFSLIR